MKCLPTCTTAILNTIWEVLARAIEQEKEIRITPMAKADIELSLFTGDILYT